MENLFVKKNPLQDLLSSLNAVISINERNWILTDHVTFKLHYNQIYQLKTTCNSQPTQPIINNEFIDQAYIASIPKSLERFLTISAKVVNVAFLFFELYQTP